MKKYILTAIAAIIFNLPSFAQQIVGGEITWHCQGNGQYIFELDLVYNCSNYTTTPPSTIELYSDSPEDTISCSMVSDNAISPNCMGSNAINCNTTDTIFHAYKRRVYTSNGIYLPGAPPASGWVFYYSSGNRPQMTNLQGTQGQVIRSIMFPYNPGGGNVSTSPCFDSSPSLSEYPIMYLASSTNYNLNITSLKDDNLDSMTVEWASPWKSISSFSGTPVSYQTNYSALEPLPDTAIHPLNSIEPLTKTGNLKCNILSEGEYATCLKVSSFLNGVKVAEIYRDLPLFIYANEFPFGLCPTSTNYCPIISPFQDTTQNYDSLVPIYSPGGDILYYNVYAFAGNHVQFGISGIDYEFLPDCTFQLIRTSINGTALTSDPTYSDSTQGSINGLSATIKSKNASGALVSTGNNRIEFNWHTSLNQGVTTGKTTYPFYFRFWDNNCNIPGTSEVLVNVILSKPIELVNDSLSLCSGDSVQALVLGNTSNLSWSPNTGISNTTSSQPYFYASTTTLYTVTDLNSGFSQNLYVFVDTIQQPVISINANELELQNAGVYDSITWRLNGAVYQNGLPPNSNTGPLFLSGEYSTMTHNGTCAANSNFIDTTFSGNYSLNPSSMGSFNGFNSSNVSYGFNFSHTANVPIQVDSVYLNAAFPDTGAISAEFRLFDVDALNLFRTDSVTIVQPFLLVFHGGFSLYPNTDYFISIYAGEDIDVQMYKPNSWPAISSNGFTTIYNASKNNGNTDYPATFSDSYPYLHFKNNIQIGIDENPIQEFRIYPNPSSGKVYFSIPGNYLILDATGRVVRNEYIDQFTDLKDLKSGVYFVKSESGKVLRLLLTH